MRSRTATLLTLLATCLLSLTLVAALQAQEQPERTPDVAEKVFRHPDLTIDAYNQSLGELPSDVASVERGRLGRLGIDKTTARLDRRSGRFVTLMPTTPLLPGRGVGNELSWGDLGFAAPPSRAAAEQAAYNALLAYLEVFRGELQIDLNELSAKYRIASHGDGDLFQIYIPRAIKGVPVRDSYVSAVIGQGNLTLLSLHQWGNKVVAAAREPISSEQAFDAAERFLDPLRIAREWSKPELVYLPMARGRSFSEVAYGQGYRYQLAWSIKVELEGYGGSWEVLVNATTGAVLANQDQNHYAEAKGGVYPVTNDGINPDGVEQAGWPMPWMTVTTSSGNVTTDTGGNLAATGSLTAALTGQYVRIADNCGTSSLTQTGNLDFGTSTGTDCVTPGFGGAGNTHAARTGFYELNRIKEMARSQLPSNTWLQGQLVSNMNINSTCNAFWTGGATGTVNFYRSGGGCANTGEIAGVFDHEWGHGMDVNDVVGGIASPSGEGIADIYAALRLNDSCIGRNFRTTVCTGNGDPCLTCTGVRDIDYLKRQSGQPHTYTWSNANCAGSVHCVGAVYAEAVWSLWKRKLQTAPFNLDNNTAHEIVNRLTFIAAGNTGTWFSGGPPNGGCAGSSGYNNYLAADDDNGNLNDGTPHMTAIHAAFNDQQIACTTPTVQNSGCASTPTAAPNVTATPGNNQVALAWGTISGASSYEVFRAEGIFACDFGKVKVANTTSTAFTDTGLQNGRNYSYVVIPKGSSAACFGNASACDTAQPGGAPPTPDFSIACTPASLTIAQGASSNSTCTVTATGGFASSVALSCTGAPAGVSCSFAPSSVTPTANSTLTVSVSGAQATGTFNFNVSGTGGSLTRTAGMSVNVIPAGGGGPQNAAYDSGLGAPKCTVVGSSCDSQSLLVGRATLGPEPNQPNTVDTCTDGTSGTFHSDESNDRIVVSTLDGSNFAPGKTVRIDATVWAWTTPSSDALDLYYAANASSPAWTFIGTIVPTAAGQQVLSATYTLPSGSMQAVRARFRYTGSAAACGTGTYDDHDDLVFSVGGATNNPPTANFTFSCTGLTCNFTDTSTDTDGTIASRAWAFGDGGTSTLQNPSRTYAAAGTYNVTLTVTDNGGATGNVTKPVTVSNAGPQTAVFDTVLQAPRCSTVGISCTTATLVNGRATLGPEINAPNTINDSCIDGTSGTYHSDESLDTLVVSTVDGTAFAPGKSVRIDATVWAWSTGSSDRLDLYYAANANSPSWVFIGTLTPPGGGARTLSATYTLPAGTLQAVRGQFRYNGTVGTCTSGSYNDRDDVVFAVNP